MKRLPLIKSFAILLISLTALPLVFSQDDKVERLYATEVKRELRKLSNLVKDAERWSDRASGDISNELYETAAVSLSRAKLQHGEAFIGSRYGQGLKVIPNLIGDMIVVGSRKKREEELNAEYERVFDLHAVIDRRIEAMYKDLKRKGVDLRFFDRVEEAIKDEDQDKLKDLKERAERGDTDSDGSSKIGEDIDDIKNGKGSTQDKINALKKLKNRKPPLTDEEERKVDVAIAELERELKEEEDEADEAIKESEDATTRKELEIAEKELNRKLKGPPPPSEPVKRKLEEARDEVQRKLIDEIMNGDETDEEKRKRLEEMRDSDPSPSRKILDLIDEKLKELEGGGGKKEKAEKFKNQDIVVKLGDERVFIRGFNGSSIVKTKYSGPKGTFLKSETPILINSFTPAPDDSGALVPEFEEEGTLTYDFEIKIDQDSIDEAETSFTAFYTLKNKSGSGGEFSVKNWEVLGPRAEIINSNGVTAEIKFSQTGSYEIIAKGETDNGSPFAITGEARVEL